MSATTPFTLTLVRKPASIVAASTGPEILTAHPIVADLKRSNRSVVAVKLPIPLSMVRNLSPLDTPSNLGNHDACWGGGW